MYVILCAIIIRTYKEMILEPVIATDNDYSVLLLLLLLSLVIVGIFINK